MKTVERFREELYEMENKMENGEFLEDEELDYYNLYQNVLDFCDCIEQNYPEIELDDFNFSSASISTYVDVVINDGIYGVRFSNHDSKPYHNSADLNYNDGFGAKHNIENLLNKL